MISLDRPMPSPQHLPQRPRQVPCLPCLDALERQPLRHQLKFPRQCLSRVLHVRVRLMVDGIRAQHAGLPVGLEADPAGDPVTVEEGQHVVSKFPFFRRGIDLDPVVKREQSLSP